MANHPTPVILDDEALAEFSSADLTLIEATAEAAGSAEIARLAAYTRDLQTRLAQVEKERDDLRAVITAIGQCQHVPKCRQCTVLVQVTLTERAGSV